MLRESSGAAACARFRLRCRAEKTYLERTLGKAPADYGDGRAKYEWQPCAATLLEVRLWRKRLRIQAPDCWAKCELRCRKQKSEPEAGSPEARHGGTANSRGLDNIKAMNGGRNCTVHTKLRPPIWWCLQSARA